MKPAFAIAPNFHLGGGWSDRLLVAENEGWRAPREDELAAPRGGDTAAVTPRLCCSRFRRTCAPASGTCWARRPPRAAAISSPSRRTCASSSPSRSCRRPPTPRSIFWFRTWAARWILPVSGRLINFSDEPLLLDWPGVRLRLGPGEGCRIDPRSPPGVVPPAEEPNVMVAIRQGRRRTIARTGSTARAKSSSRSRSSRSPADC